MSGALDNGERHRGVAGRSPAKLKRKRTYRKKDPLFYEEHKAKVRATTEKKVREVLDSLKSMLRRKIKFPKQAVQETLQYRVKLAHSLRDERSDEQVQIAYLRDTIQRNRERDQRLFLQPPRRQLKEQDRLIREQKARERRLRGILGRQPLSSQLEDDQEALVAQTFEKSGKIAQIPGAGVEAHDIAKLRPFQWLNDEVINFYMKLIERRNNLAVQKRAEGKEARRRLTQNNYEDEQDRLADLKLATEVKRTWNGILDVHVFNTFFFEKLSKSGYGGVRQWTRKVDIFSKDRILMPINRGQMHWVCASINMRDCCFEFYDSMHAGGREVFDVLSEYLRAEYADKKKEEFGTLHVEDWQRINVDSSPAQSNGYDCGMFAAMTIEQLSRRDPWLGAPPEPMTAQKIVEKSSSLATPARDDIFNRADAETEEWNFSQSNIPYLRRRMVYEIVKGELLNK
jgi:sentrin-specific protease 1